eukprot:308252-Pelagomonas_calceolata.AAC.1
MASPLDYNAHYHHYWRSDPRDILFGAHYNSFSSRFSGISICHPNYDEKAMKLALRHEKKRKVYAGHRPRAFRMYGMLSNLPS